jgi:hypothetical protein
MPEAKKKFRSLLAAAETALEEGVARAARFEDAQDFKRSLLKALDSHAGFKAAAKIVHAHAKTPPPGHNQVSRKIVPSGRPQAARHDTPRGRASHKR